MNYFISYGDDRFKVSLDRIARQARRVGIFDRIIKYTPKDLPEHIKASPLFAFDKGGGYWCWKPYIIYHTLQDCKEGDVVYYADAGCSLSKDSDEWTLFERQIQDHTAIFFQYRDGVDYGKEFRGQSAAIKNWTKPSTKDYFLRFVDAAYLDYNKVWGGFMIFRKALPLSIILDQWYSLTLFHPELICDPCGAELSDVSGQYTAHRHDQSILTPLIYHFHEQDNALVLPETAESRIGNPAVVASRWRQAEMSWFLYLKYRIYETFHHNDKSQ